MADTDNRRSESRFEVKDSFAKVHCAPFEVAGASAKVKPDGILGALTGYPRKRYRVLNISKGGVAIETDEPFRKGQRIRLQLRVPDWQEAMELSGAVRWQKSLVGGEILRAGVRFDPFGTRRGLNSLSSLDALRDLEAKYARPPDG